MLNQEDEAIGEWNQVYGPPINQIKKDHFGQRFS